MDTYDRITKNLSLFTFETTDPIPLGTPLFKKNKAIGEVTSISQTQENTQQGLVLLKLKENEIKEGTFHISISSKEVPALLLARPAAQRPHD